MSGRMMSDRELSSVEIRQGFICPFCLNDLGSVELLQAHVTELHPNPTNTDNNDVLMHVKGFFDKAKQRIRNFDTTAAEWTSFTGATTTNVLQRRSPDERQSIGATRTHSDYFRASRDQCVNQIAVATNNLIIRLDKLVNECPTDLNQRREFERAIVPWTSDSDCANCRVCASKFSITRRRHHCRLCGKIMCNSCSKFLSFLIAKKLTNPAFAAEHRQQQLVDDDRNRIEQQQQQQNDDSTSLGSSNSPVRQLVKQKTGKLLSATLSLMKRDGSEVSLSSLLDQDAEEHLRICFDCKTLLDRRDEMMDLRATPPIIVQLPAFTSVKNSVSS